ncbi:MAG: DUF177 domain-containing protein [Alphaproteobacteria bacterium]|nr:DUF177 domain-containing protein [Alphaproteobacteria bacterium]
MQPEFSRLISTEHIDSAGKTHEITASPAECEALAQRFSLEGILHLSASIFLQRESAGRIKASGTFTAQIIQKSAISLEPFSSTICEDFTTLFTEGEEYAEEIDIDSDKEDIDFISEGRIDIGELTAEYLALAIPLFPRQEDETFTYKNEPEDTENTQKNPFAVLKDLK